MKAYVITCKLFGDRLEAAISALQSCNLEPRVIRSWDADEIDHNMIANGSELRWANSVREIAPVLMANALLATGAEHEFKEAHERSDMYLATGALPAWMQPRSLKAGEVSVLMKHFHAISAIANGEYSHGLIAEDDILAHAETPDMFQIIRRNLGSRDIDYLDIAGGSGLQARRGDDSDKSIELMQIPRTRTNACYIVSKKYAKTLANRFFPLIFPIDWHIQYIFALRPPSNCYWAIDNALLHGSELDCYKSWRNS